MYKKNHLLLFLSLLLPFGMRAQETDSTQRDKIKKGLNIGALPSVLYNSDLGFQYGALAQLFNYGDGSLYPEYKWSVYGELARTTKGGGINQLTFDAQNLLPKKIRWITDVSYLTQQALDFYGFNGYQAVYNPNFEDGQSNEYISRMFYRLERKLLRIATVFRGNLIGDHVYYLAGFSYYDMKIAPVDIDRLNEGKDEKDLLPHVAGLYQRYVDWGLIPENEKNGGQIKLIKLGLTYDSRDNEPNPMHGIWSEAILAIVPEFLGNNENAYTKLALVHRQYFTLIKDRLSLAGRLGYQGTIDGHCPFYMQSYMIESYPKSTTIDGLGGKRTLRGILRNRVVGDGIAYGNLEMRWKFHKTYWMKQNFYFALNAFLDAGRIVKDIDLDLDKVPYLSRRDFFDETADDAFHVSTGLGLRFAMNQNFVFGLDYGIPLDERDGKGGIYIGLNYIF